mmetsp:Transcript_18992/g.40852  ORF Transcript_18992/g.40852 Transcript_18992/m.40852 type:complete len:82 (-) Transcript_18992:3039-3284(-)
MNTARKVPQARQEMGCGIPQIHGLLCSCEILCGLQKLIVRVINRIEREWQRNEGPSSWGHLMVVNVLIAASRMERTTAVLC